MKLIKAWLERVKHEKDFPNLVVSKVVDGHVERVN